MKNNEIKGASGYGKDTLVKDLFPQAESKVNNISEENFTESFLNQPEKEKMLKLPKEKNLQVEQSLEDLRNKPLVHFDSTKIKERISKITQQQGEKTLKTENSPKLKVN